MKKLIKMHTYKMKYNNKSGIGIKKFKNKRDYYLTI